MHIPTGHHPEKDIENAAPESGLYAIAYAILRLADAQEDIARAMEQLDPLAGDVKRIARALEAIADR